MFLKVFFILLLTVPLFAESNAGWILENSVGSEVSEEANKFYQSDFRSSYTEGNYRGASGLMPLLMSAIVPGTGEIYTGHYRGLALVALDVAVWMKRSSYNKEGDDIKAEYFAFADEHWSLNRLLASCNTGIDPAGYEDDLDLCANYYGTTSSYTELSLWVSIEDDRREYYENLGKWDQFVFGWDDFLGSPQSIEDGPAWVNYLAEFDDPGFDTAVLNDGRVSPNREFYRSLRKKSNDAYANADKMIWVALLTRVVSVFQTAYLNGMIFDGTSDGVSVAGHDLNLIAQSEGNSGSRFGISLSY
jgi:hypothetical protein